MSYQVLARKLRPAAFDALVGQEHVVRALVHALDSGRVHHAYLFTGTRGVGKTTIARILAKALNCERGVSATPCGECSVCHEIAEGRFGDLIEVDAASRTGVDATRDLLDNAQFLPARGRYKIYLIDEVHMLSQASFNALLKTLEEPPEHVKFLLATTDPRRVPVTVLSRCLQFQLKNLLPERIGAYLEHVLGEEAIEFEEQAVAQIARAASGSMRDALSLTDQALAYGGGRLLAQDVSALLGTVERDELGQLLEHLAAGDGAGLLALCGRLGEQAVDFAEVLRGLLSALHDIAVVQIVGGADRYDAPFVARMAQRLAPETVQLYYQIVLMGLKDLALAPDPQSGFEMVLLRLLAFEPVPPDGRSGAAAPQAGGSAAPPVDSAARSAAPSGAPPEQGADGHGRARGGAGPRLVAVGSATLAQASEPALQPREDHDELPGPAVPAPAEEARDPALAATGRPWHELLSCLELGGVARMLAEHSLPSRIEGCSWELCLDAAHDTLLNEKQEQAVAQALGAYLRAQVSLRIVTGTPPGETPAARHARERRERHRWAVEVLQRDRHVRSLIEELDAELNLASVRYVEPDS